MDVYLIRNTVNNKIYIGKTNRTVAERWKEHIRDARAARFPMPLHRAINKYGASSFTHEVLAQTDSETELVDLEIALIKQHNSSNKQVGYNATNGGDGGPAKAGEKHHFFGKKFTEQHRANLRAAKLINKRTWSPEQKKQMSARFSGQGNPMFGKSGSLHPSFGKHLSEETRRKISEAATRREAVKRTQSGN